MPALDPQSLPRHLDRLYRAAWALCGSPHDAEDLVQETCARVLARPRRLRGQDELAYLMTVLRNTFLTQRRTAARRPRVGSATLEEIDPADHRVGERPEEALQAREVFAVIATLPERYRLALVAVDIAGLSYREAAGVLETREATIATRVFRARQQVARKLAPETDPDGVGVPAGEADSERRATPASAIATPASDIESRQPAPDIDPKLPKSDIGPKRARSDPGPKRARSDLGPRRPASDKEPKPAEALIPDADLEWTDIPRNDAEPEQAEVPAHEAGSEHAGAAADEAGSERAGAPAHDADPEREPPPADAESAREGKPRREALRRGGKVDRPSGVLANEVTHE